MRLSLILLAAIVLLAAIDIHTGRLLPPLHANTDGTCEAPVGCALTSASEESRAATRSRPKGRDLLRNAQRESDLMVSVESMAIQQAVQLHNEVRVWDRAGEQMYSDFDDTEIVTTGPVTYVVTVENQGTAQAFGVVVRDLLPFGTTVVDNPDGGIISPGGKTIEWTIETFPPGAYRQFTFSVDM